MSTAALTQKLKQALDRSDLELIQAEAGKPARLVLPPEGIQVARLADFAEEVFGGGLLADALDPDKLGFKAGGSPLQHLVLTRFEVESPQDPGADCLLELRWRGASWTLIPDFRPNHDPFLAMHDPGVAVQVTRGEIRATLFGGFLLADAIDVNVFVTVWYHEGPREANRQTKKHKQQQRLQTPVIYGDLAPGGPYRLKPLFTHLGLDLPGIDDLAIQELSFFAATGDQRTASFRISLADPWKPGWGEGKLELTGVTFAILRAGKRVTGKVSAKARIAGRDAEVAIENAGYGWALSAAVPDLDLALGRAIGKLGEEFGLGDLLAEAPGLEGLTIAGLSLEIGLEERSLDFELWTPGAKDAEPQDAAPEVVDPHAWKVCDGLAVEKLSLRIRHQGRPSSQTTIDVSGKVRICGVEIDAEIGYGGRDQGWTLSVESHFGNGKPLVDLLTGDDALPSGMGLSIDDFGGIGNDVRVTRLELSANTHTRNFALKLAGALDVGSGKTLGLEIDVELTKKPGAGQPTQPVPAGGYDQHFSGRIWLDPDPEGRKRQGVGAPDRPPPSGSRSGGRAHGLEFDLLFDKSDEGSAIVAAFENHAGKTASLGNLMQHLGYEEKLPLDLNLRKAALVAAKKKQAAADGSKYDYILVVDMDAGLNLSKLPLVSKMAPSGQGLEVAFQPLYASRPFLKEEVGRLQGLLPANAPGLFPRTEEGGGEAAAAQAIGEGLQMAAHVRLGGKALELPWQFEKPTADHPLVPTTPPEAEGTGEEESQKQELVKWFSIQKSLGPIHFQRLGLGLKLEPEAEIEVLLDAALGAGGLTLSLMGLGAGYRLSDRTLHFHLSGLGLSYEAGPTAISGTFLKLGDLDFVGEAMIRTPAFGISALGAYSDGKAGKSLFVYAFLDYPLGGPPFFFVEGLAAGFGYNREVRDVPIGEVASFPLVSEVYGTEKGKPPAGLLPPPKSAEESKNLLADKMVRLNHEIHPVAGEHFLALGVKFNSFKMIDSFALAIVSFGHRFRLDILGKSTAAYPPAPSPYHQAFVEMAFKVRFDPEEGLLAVQAELTDRSWVYTPDCHLTGGFAFFSWMKGEHAGDFVNTLGGYHPDFKVPQHYPRVPRLGFNWQVDQRTLIKGGLYFALVPNFLMAGGFLEASWRSGGLWAEFKLGIDFLIQWKPFHYQAHAYIEISGGAGSLSGSLGADLTLHGPDFGGSAEVDFVFTSFRVEFGDQPDAPPPLSWQEFHDSFLPHDDHEITTLTVESGLLRSMEKDGAEKDDGKGAAAKRWIVNPKAFSLAVSSLVPFKSLVIGRGKSAAGMVNPDSTRDQKVDGRKVDFGVAPMKVSSVPTATLKITVYRDEAELDAPVDFTFTPIPKRFPAAMWSPPADPKAPRKPVKPGLTKEIPRDAGKAGLDGDRTIRAPGGTVIAPRKPVKPGRTKEIPRRHLDYEVQEIEIGKAKAWPLVAYPDGEGQLTAPRGAERKDRDRKQLRQTDAVDVGRRALLAALGFTPAADVRLREELPEDFILAPRVTASASG